MAFSTRQTLEALALKRLAATAGDHEAFEHIGLFLEKA